MQLESVRFLSHAMAVVRGGFGVFIITLAMTMSTRSAAADLYLDMIGGHGGGPFNARCPAGQLLSGFELRAADDVDALRPLCVTAYGPTQTSTASDSAWHGGSGGASTFVVCPRRVTPAVTGMYVNFEGAHTVVVNSIHLFCDLAVGEQLASEYTAAFFDAPAYDDDNGFFVGDNHFASGTQRCPAGQVAVGVHGRSGVWLDAIGLICGTPQVAVQSLGRVGTPSPTGARMSLCERARDARARNSPAAANLEAQCQASKTTVSSLGKSATTTPIAPAPRMSICERARDARARNSPAAPNLEAQCNATGSRTATSQPLPALPPPPPSPGSIDGVQALAHAQLASNRRRSDSYPINGSSTTTLDRHHGTQTLPRTEASAEVNDGQQQSTDERQAQAERNEARGTFYIDREVRRHDPYVRNGLDSRQIDRGSTAQELSQPLDSIHVEVRYPTAYGYRDAQSQSAFGGNGPDSCYAFHIEAITGPQDPEVHGLIGIEYGAKPMREWNGMYICAYLISNLPHDEPISVRVAMTGDRTSAGDVWLGGSQPRPGRQQRRAILDDEQSVVLTADQPRASLGFEMIYAGPH